MEGRNPGHVRTTYGYVSRHIDILEGLHRKKHTTEISHLLNARLHSTV